MENWQPVAFKCMIQDILGNEIYSKDETGGQGDSADKLGDRTIYYCISIPGENEWVRNVPTDDDSEFMHSPIPSQRTEKDRNNRLSFTLVNSSYPIPSEGMNRACLIKIYDLKLLENLRVNDIVHVNGYLEPAEFEDDSELSTNKTTSRDRVDSSSPDVPTNNNHNNDLGNQLFDFEPARDFPHRLVPRVHVKELKKLNHINPLVPEIIARDTLDIKSLKLTRSRLANIFTQLLDGDSLAAEYIVLSLISRIHRIKDVTTLGQMTIGLRGVKPEMKFLVGKIYEIISKITTHSHLIEMSIANLNNLRFTPKKDHDNNKMIAGTLQLPDGLYLVIDETVLSEGQLTQQGTANVATLNQIIRWQKHKYDFKFVDVEIDTDLKVLVLSEGRSLLAVPYSIPLKSNDKESIMSMQQACDSVNDFLTDDLLNSFRHYITALKDVPDYNISDDVQKTIQDNFIQWRQEAAENEQNLFSANDLASYMNIARYLTISRGETNLTTDTWNETCKMELQRQARLKVA